MKRGARKIVLFLVLFPIATLLMIREQRLFGDLSTLFDNIFQSGGTNKAYDHVGPTGSDIAPMDEDQSADDHDGSINLNSNSTSPNEPSSSIDEDQSADDQDGSTNQNARSTSSPKPSPIVAILGGTNQNSNSTTPHESCGWNTSLQATWTRNSKDENASFLKVMACHRRLSPSKKERWNEKERPPPSSLRCGDNIMDELYSIVSCYDRIVFFGDSIQRQQFFTLSCMLNSSLTLKDFLPAKRKDDEFRWTYPGTDTALMFRGSPKGLQNYGIFRNISSVESNPRYAAVVNLGAHYHPNNNSTLEKDARIVAESAEQTTTSMFWVETIDFQWPTTNGEFVNACSDCQCEALTPGRIAGTGAYTGPDRYVNSAKYPTYKSLVVTNHTGPCIPYCWPANWRNHVTNNVMTNPKYSAINLVPVWQQLVSSGFAQSRFAVGDCTHKSTDALMAVVQQLLRSMKKRCDQRGVSDPHVITL
ncbi:unnamed protein product [Cylindrotheca closterium]|uniref:Uncharacterized protein n=1 Tax=Cylindrotheca closterium TaxID=2856 RepID=A0AAD2FSA2_9STRA|nr:unnamed protein product [Cylindrotheca closterium]